MVLGRSVSLITKNLTVVQVLIFFICNIFIIHTQVIMLQKMTSIYNYISIGYNLLMSWIARK